MSRMCIYMACIECMVTSNNVVRAGLTPEFRDVQKLSLLYLPTRRPSIKCFTAKISSAFPSWAQIWSEPGRAGPSRAKYLHEPSRARAGRAFSFKIEPS
ncbi:mannose-6-phosphate isomerase [Carex littledalei]|uniref:Mannose-6-phosphate isomerase n=1 Tax=Carex littledalei TaxID=544730 RepID=A0A833QS17_9POAL|nr:mannose-6-phosphate isomerase [Carex littledalei]